MSIIGKEILNYRIISMIDKDCMCDIYLAEHVIVRTLKVVIKMIIADRVNDFTYRILENRVRHLAKFNFHNIVSFYGCHIDKEGNIYLIKEYIEGETIEQHVNKCGAYYLDEAINLMVKILEAVQFIHDRHLIHRYINPLNIMIRPKGIVCIDFDVTKDTCIGVTRQLVGRNIDIDVYMSPEQVVGLNVDHRTDIYSLGCVFYYLLTGKHAVHEGKNEVETMSNIIDNIMPLPSQACSSIPASVNKVFLKSVDKNMMKRYKTAYEFKEALENV